MAELRQVRVTGEESRTKALIPNVIEVTAGTLSGRTKG